MGETNWARAKDRMRAGGSSSRSATSRVEYARISWHYLAVRRIRPENYWIGSRVIVSSFEVVGNGEIGIAHEKWTERPLLIIVPVEGRNPDEHDLLALFKGKVADWWIPDEVAFVDGLPHTATGKVSKLKLRKQFADYSVQSGE